MKDYPRIARKITTTLFAAQSLGSASLIVSGTVSTIVGAQLSGNPAWAGLPSAVLQLGAAFAALVIGALMDRIGRRGGLSLGLFIGVLGAGIAVVAIQNQSFILFLGGLVAIGVAQAATMLGRFAAAEVHPPDERGRAISNVVIGGTVGAVVGPLLVGPSGQWALRIDMEELSGPFLAALILSVLVTLVIFIWLRPDPRDIGREIAELHPETVGHQGPTRSFSQLIRTRAVFVAVSAMVLGQMVMIMIMGITSLHMKDNQHPLSNISIVIAAHTFGMFALSTLSGQLTDRWGRGKVILSGSGLLILACGLAPLSLDVLPLSIALFLLGLGWNFCYVGGSALLSDQLSPEERAKTQGANDLLIGLMSATGSLGSGLVFASLGYPSLGVLGIGFSFSLMTLVGWWMMKR